MERAVDATRPADQRWQDEVAVVGRRIGIPITVAIVALTALSTAVGMLLTGAPGRSVVEYDLDLVRDMAATRTATWNGITAVTTVLADSTTVATLWVGVMLFAAWRTRSWRIPIFLLAAIGGEKLNYLLTSIFVGRPRPPVDALGHVFVTNSFPSGHVGSAIALYGGLAIALLWHRSRSWGRPRSLTLEASLAGAVIVLGAIVAFSRMYRGHHYLSDVVWGALLGVAWLAIAWVVVLRPRGKIAAYG